MRWVLTFFGKVAFVSAIILAVSLVLLGCGDTNTKPEPNIYEVHFGYCRSACPNGIDHVSYSTLSGTLECFCK